MSDLIILDGLGTGKRSGVTHDNRFMTAALNIPKQHYMAERYQQGFLFGTGVLAQPAAETPVLWVQNTSADKNLAIDRFFFGSNGGTANRNRQTTIRAYGGATVPTANRTAVVPGNSFFGSAKIAPATVYKWDGVGAGMTIAALGALGWEALIGPGVTDIFVSGFLIIPPAMSVVLTSQGEEVGQSSIITTCWFDGVEDAE